MTEEQIERRVERAFDALDARLIDGDVTQSEYDVLAKQIDAWARAMLAKRER